MKRKIATRKTVPEGMRVQLSRLFGSDSRIAGAETRTDREWRRVLLDILREIDSYLTVNIRTDSVHLLMLHSGLYAAHEALKQEDFWPGYAEGITRLALILMGGYPDHRKRRTGRKEEKHYNLSQLRSCHYTQSDLQKLRTLMAAPRVGIALKTNPDDALHDFRRHFGYKPGYDRFFKWYRQNHPEDYAAVF
jgi:hypothetical protein